MQWQEIINNKIRVLEMTYAQAQEISEVEFYNLEGAAIFEILLMANGRASFSVKDRTRRNIFQLKQLTK